VFAGRGGAVTVDVCAEAADVEPPSLEPVTTDRTVSPTSAATNVYVDDVAPLIFEHDNSDEHRCH
jgi:hypothetical protein